MPKGVYARTRRPVTTPLAGRAEARRALTAITACQLCGRAGAFSRRGLLHVHHLNGDPLDNRPENLIKVCPWHHRMAHVHPEEFATCLGGTCAHQLCGRAEAGG